MVFSALSRPCFVVACAVLLWLGSARVHAEEIAFDSNLSEGMSVTNTVRIVGWAKTPNSSGSVKIYLDQEFLGNAAYPLSRTDVPNSGFILEFDSLAFSNGPHTLTAKSYTAQGQELAQTSLGIRVANTPTRGVIEWPQRRDPAAGSIGVGGWALAKDGFQKLEIQVNGRYAGMANYGLPRPDVQSAFPEYNLPNSGFNAVVDLDSLGLPRGYHRLALVGVSGDNTRAQVAESEFFYTPGRTGRSFLDAPFVGSTVSAEGGLRIAGWSEGEVPATRIDVYVDDRHIGGSTQLNVPRPDVPGVFPGVTNLSGFDFILPSTQLVSGEHRIVAVVTDIQGRRANLDVFSGPVKFRVAASEKLFGVHLRPTNTYGATIGDYQRDIQIAPKMVMYFQPWRIADGRCTPFNEYPFLPNSVANAGAILMLTWEPHQEGLGSQNAVRFSYDRILAGDHDACITQTAREIRSFAYPVLIRFAHEMNGQSNTWTGIANGNNPDGYVQVFRKVVDIFRAEAASNARFVWAPDHASPPEVPSPANEIRNYYPGDGYVDFIGVSGYNWGNDPLRGGGWVTGEQIFKNFLQTMARSYPGKPVVISEIGSVPSYGNFSRSQWYSEAMTYFASRPEIKGIVWFNDYAFAQSNQADFRFSDTAGFPPVNTGEKSLMRQLIGQFESTRN